MSRSDYTEDFCIEYPWAYICWRGAVTSALKGKRGQAFLREALVALDGMDEKKLIVGELVDKDGYACLFGTVGQLRNLDMKRFVGREVDREVVGQLFGVADAMAAEIMYANDEHWRPENPHQRWIRMRGWISPSGRT